MSRENPLVGNATIRLFRSKKDMKDSRAQHVCSALRCNPETEGDLIQNGHLDAPALTSNIYLCQMGVVHVCSEDTCELYISTPTQTCPISKIVHGTIQSSYVRDEPKTWYSPIAPPVAVVSGTKKRQRPSAKTDGKRRHLDVSDADVRLRAGAMVKALLFSRKRIQRNDVELERNRAAANERCAAYTRHMRSERQLPYWSDLYRIRGMWMQHPLPLREFEFDEDLHDYYVSVVQHVWALVVKHSGAYTMNDVSYAPLVHVDVETVTIGVLYGMKKGKHHKGYILLPRDVFLAENLPVIGDLDHYFGVERNRVTYGDNMLTEVYERAMAQHGGSPQSLVLDAKMLAPAKPTVEDEAHLATVRATSNVPVKMTTNGDILFMPKSRVKRMCTEKQ